jgi:CDP-paratose 2-epimerase
MIADENEASNGDVGQSPWCAAMKLLITGICGFVGQTVARGLLEIIPGLEVIGVDSLVRPGSELSRRALSALGVKFFHADVRSRSDIELLPACDWVLDAAANASVLAGLSQPGASRQLIEHNLIGTVNLLEYCRRHKAGFILLSTSRVYSVAPLASLEMEVDKNAFRPSRDQSWPQGCSPVGLAESFATAPPLSLYGASKLASEMLAAEYGSAFDFPVWLNRCGVLAGAGQFGRPDQGIFSYWLHAYAAGKPLKYIGFDGQGHQVRDALHPDDLLPVLVRQFEQPSRRPEPALNFGGGLANSMSLAQLSDWCAARFEPRPVATDPAPRPYDVPWLVMDSRAAEQRWQWRPKKTLLAILEDIAAHAEGNPHWLDLTGG